MELRLPTPAQLKTAYETDFRASFPPAELKPLANIEKMWAEGWYRPWCLFDGETLVGEAFLWLGHPGWALLDYLCVSPRRRGGGLGGAILAKLREKEAGTVILGESEEPAHAPDESLARRRLAFYARNGARIAGYDTDMFGVHYKTFYFAKEPLRDGRLMAEHRFIYQNRFSPEKYEKYVRIPRDPAAPPFPQVPWQEGDGKR